MILPEKIEGTGVASWEYDPVSAIVPKVGTAMAYTSGKLAICGATAVPTHICMREATATATAGDLIPVI